jgi:hypothetical protein
MYYKGILKIELLLVVGFPFCCITAVIPAKAGIQEARLSVENVIKGTMKYIILFYGFCLLIWIPAFAGMTTAQYTIAVEG